jgi:protein kinase C substrate 80K-H
MNLEKECCDGSDEPSGACPNTCQEMGAKHRKKVDAERKLRKTVSFTCVQPIMSNL